MANIARGIDGVESEWNYHDSHLTELTDKNFLSAARCIVYARPTKLTDDSEDAVFQKIGVIQGYNWQENKQVEIIFELGSDIPYLIPGRTTGSISISRILIAGADLVNVLYSDVENVADGEMTMGGWIRSLRDVTTPVDLLIAYYDQASDAVYTRIFSNAWMANRNESIQAGSVIVTEGVSLFYQAVSQYNTSAGTSKANPREMY